jgi:hypothetical protein
VPTQRAAGSAGVTPGVTKRESIGDKIIEGFTCEGQRFTSTIPANSSLGNADPIELKSEIYFSGELQLPLLTISENPLVGTSIQRYTNIKAGIEPDATLFRVPDGYTSVGR